MVIATGTHRDPSRTNDTEHPTDGKARGPKGVGRPTARGAHRSHPTKLPRFCDRRTSSNSPWAQAEAGSCWMHGAWEESLKSTLQLHHDHQVCTSWHSYWYHLVPPEWSIQPHQRTHLRIPILLARAMDDVGSFPDLFGPNDQHLSAPNAGSALGTARVPPRTRVGPARRGGAVGAAARGDPRPLPCGR